MEASYCHFYVTKMTNLIRKKGKPKVFDMINQVRLKNFLSAKVFNIGIPNLRKS